MNHTPKTSVSYVTIDSDQAGQRVDNFLITKLKNVPKTRIYRLLRKGEVRVNKKRVGPDYRLQSGDEVRIPPVFVQTEIKLTKPPIDMASQLKNAVIYEDKNVLVINKPPGIAVHGGTKTKWGVIEILRTLYPDYPYLELVHRLDVDTSGCLMIAKRRSTLRDIHSLLRAGQVKKEYWALTKGHWKPQELHVDLPLMKNKLSSGERIVKVEEEGKDSMTEFDILKIFPEATLVKARLLTGRTHQIRVHAQSQHHPIACDEKYGDKSFNKRMKDLGLKRLFLHSHTLELTLATGQVIKVIAELPDDLKQCLGSLE